MSENKNTLLMECEGLDISFGGIKAVDNFNMTISKGEIIGLIGPNGAGKTTIFNIITQFYKPDAGHVYFYSQTKGKVDLCQHKTHEVIQVGLARTFQNIELVKDLSLLDNVLVGGHIHFKTSLFSRMLRLPKARKEEQVMREKAMELLKYFEIDHLSDQLADGQPYGVLKKTELARALLSDPQLLILDEPAAGLNDSETADLAKLIKQIIEQFDCAILLIEHDMRLVMGICDRLYAISFGKTLDSGTPEHIQNSTVVQEAYLGEVEDE